MDRIKQSKWFTFVVVAIAQFIVVLDSAITNVALPTIKQQLHFSDSTIQWVVTAYALTFGGFLLLGGRAADLFGRRRMLLYGMAGFTLFSFLIGVSHTPLLLIVFRALQGLSAAFMSPAALSIVISTFDEGPKRNQALGYWTLVSTAGAAVGLLLGGVLTQLLNWRWNFFVNVPVGLFMLAVIPRFIPKHAREDKYTGLDLPGATLITSSLMLQVFAFSQAESWGWLSGRILGILAVAVMLLIAFLVNEGRIAKHPLMPLSIFKIRNVTGANMMMAPMYGTMLGLFFVITLYLQQILHFTPIETGLAFLPFPIILGIMATRIPKLVARYGYKRWLVVGPGLVAAGLLWMSHLTPTSHYWPDLLPAILVIPVGVGMTFMPIIAAATSGVPRGEAGLASGLISTSQQMGGALGLAILSGIAASVTASSGYLGVRGALVHGFDIAMLVAIAFMVFTILLAVFVIKQKSTGPKGPEVMQEKAQKRQVLQQVRET